MFTRRDIPVGSLVDGTPLNIPVFEIPGTGKGPSVHIQAGVHGAELQGHAVILRLLEAFAETPPLGTVTLVPTANPFGINLKIGEYTHGRFSPISGENYNRRYWHATFGKPRSRRDADQIDLDEFVTGNLEADWDTIRTRFREHLVKSVQGRRDRSGVRGMSPEDRIAITLQGLACRADIVLDLHTGSEAPRYLFAPTYAQQSSRYLGFPSILMIPNQFGGAMDEASFCPWWELSETYARHGRTDVPVGVEAFTLELGSQEKIDLHQARKDCADILNYLRHRGVMEGSAAPLGEPRFGALQDYITLHAPIGGLVHYHVPAGAYVSTGDLIAEILTFAPVRSAADLPKALVGVRAPAEGVVLYECASSGVIEGMELFKLMTSVTY